MVRKDPLERASEGSSRRARKLVPADVGDLETEAAKAQREMQRDTRRIGAGLTIGTAGRRAGQDVRATYDMFPVASTRVQMMGYNEDTQIVRVVFRDGTPWEYFDVTPQEWDGFRTAESPGRYINAVLNEKPYGRGSF